MKATPISLAASHERSYFVLGLTWPIKPECTAPNSYDSTVQHMSHEDANLRTTGGLLADTEMCQSQSRSLAGSVRKDDRGIGSQDESFRISADFQIECYYLLLGLLVPVQADDLRARKQHQTSIAWLIFAFAYILADGINEKSHATVLVEGENAGCGPATHNSERRLLDEINARHVRDFFLGCCPECLV